jgi:hypothetical protein
MGFVASQHLDTLREKLHLHDFSRIGEDLLEIKTQPSAALSKLLLKPADIPELMKHFQDVIPLAKDKKETRRRQIKSSAHDEEYFEKQSDEEYDVYQDVVQPSIKFASLKEQSLFYGDIPDYNPINFHDVKVGQEIPEKLAVDIEGFVTSAEKAGMSRDGVQSLRKLVKKYEDIFRLKLSADPPANMNLPVIKLRDGAEPVRMSACKYDPAQLMFMLYKIRELDGLKLVYKNYEAEWASPDSSF